MSEQLRLSRRSFILAGAALLAAGNGAQAAGKRMLVYITAANCPNCAKFYFNGGLSKMKALAAQKGVEVRTIDVLRFQSYAGDPFPSDLAWLKEQGVARGAPRFVLISGRSIVKNVLGASKYNKDIKALIEAS